MANITKVPNGPLIKKKGPFKGSTLKSGGVVKKAQGGERITRFMTDKEYKKKNDSLSKSFRKNDPGFFISPKTPIKNIDPGFTKTPENYNPNIKRKRVTSKDGALQYLKNGNKVKKAQNGEYITQEEQKWNGKNMRGYTATKKVNTKNGPRYYQSKSPDLDFSRSTVDFKINANPADSIPKAKLSPRAIEMMNQKNGGKVRKAQNGDSTKVSTTMTPYMQKRAAQQLVREANIRKRDSILQRNANVAGITREELREQQRKNDRKPDVSPSGDNAISLKDARQSDCKITSKKNCGVAKEANRQNKKQRFKNGGVMKKAQVGSKVVKGPAKKPNGKPTRKTLALRK